jgi:hypothetical protein
MPRQEPQYVIFVDDEGEKGAMFMAPLEPGDRDYFKNVLRKMRPLSDHEYMNGLDAIRHTLARYSYILWEECVFWCVEWDSGLIVIRFSPDGSQSGHSGPFQSWTHFP